MTVSVAVILVAYNLILYFELLPFTMPRKLIALTNFGIAFQFLIGSAIITHKKAQEPASFVLGFIVLTTFQIIAIISLLLAVKFISDQFIKDFVIHFFSLFFPLFIIQNILLLKLAKRQ